MFRLVLLIGSSRTEFFVFILLKTGRHKYDVDLDVIQA